MFSAAARLPRDCGGGRKSDGSKRKRRGRRARRCMRSESNNSTAATTRTETTETINKGAGRAETQNLSLQYVRRRLPRRGRAPGPFQKRLAPLQPRTKTETAAARRRKNI